MCVVDREKEEASPITGVHVSPLPTPANPLPSMARVHGAVQDAPSIHPSIPMHPPSPFIHPHSFPSLLRHRYMERYKTSIVKEAVVAYEAVAAKHGLTPSELALAWCQSRWGACCWLI